MPQRQAKTKTTVAAQVPAKLQRTRSSSKATSKEIKMEDEAKTAYDHILRKVQENRAKQGKSGVFITEQEPEQNSNPKKKKLIAERVDSEVQLNLPPDQVTATFIEDDNFIDMDITGLRSTFPSENEDEEDQESESNVTGSSKNNNVTVNRHLE